MRRLTIPAIAALLAVIVFAPSGAGATAARTAKVTQSKVSDTEIVKGGFSPAKITIRNGDTVKWTWDKKNQANHSVYLDKKPKGAKFFTSQPAVARRSPYSHKFIKPGSYMVVCTVHNDLYQTITVKK